MADRPNPYVRKDPGDIIRSGDWNELQVRAREEIHDHRHTGGDDGTLIPRTGIEEKAIDGSRIDPEAAVTVKTLTVTGDLKVNGKAILGDVNDLLATVKGLDSGKLNRAGDTVTGSLTIKQMLSVSNGVGIGIDVPQAKLQIINTTQDANGNTLILGPTNGANLRLGYHTDYSWIQSQGSKPLAINPVGNNVGIGTTNPHPDYKLDVNGSVKLGGFTEADADEWPKIVWYRDPGKNWDEGVIKHSSGRGFFGRSGFGIHIHETRDWGIWSTGWNPLFGVEGGTGNTKIRGRLEIQGSDIYFTETAHNHTGIGNTLGFAAIENAANYNTLMILGRTVSTNPLKRSVSVWDELNVNGNLKVTGSVSCGGRIGIRSVQWGKYLGVSNDQKSVYAGPNFDIWEYFTLEMACSRDFKENINNLTAREALTTLAKLRPIKYEYKGEKSFRQNLGFIAEEMPENLASYDRRSISPFEIIPVLTRVMQEHHRTIVELKSTIKRVLQEIA